MSKKTVKKPPESLPQSLQYDLFTTFFGEAAEHGFGRSLAVGDVNGDLIDDLVVGAIGIDDTQGAPQYDIGGAYVFYGGALAPIIDAGGTGSAPQPAQRTVRSNGASAVSCVAPKGGLRPSWSKTCLS